MRYQRPHPFLSKEGRPPERDRSKKQIPRRWLARDDNFTDRDKAHGEKRQKKDGGLRHGGQVSASATKTELTNTRSDAGIERGGRVAAIREAGLPPAGRRRRAAAATKKNSTA
jgi:hypothetical protein